MRCLCGCENDIWSIFYTQRDCCVVAFCVLVLLSLQLDTWHLPGLSPRFKKVWLSHEWLVENFIDQFCFTATNCIEILWETQFHFNSIGKYLQIGPNVVQSIIYPGFLCLIFMNYYKFRWIIIIHWARFFSKDHFSSFYQNLIFWRFLQINTYLKLFFHRSERVHLIRLWISLNSDNSIRLYAGSFCSGSYKWSEFNRFLQKCCFTLICVLKVQKVMHCNWQFRFIALKRA